MSLAIRHLTPLVFLAPAVLPAQDTTRTFFTRRDFGYLGVAVAATAVSSIFDARVAHWAAQPSTQGSSSRQSTMRTLTNWSGETTLTWAAAGGYVVGRLTHSKTTAEVALHLVEAQALTSVFGQAVRGIMGRSRPSVSGDTTWNLHWGQGFSHWNYRSFPSLHSAAGFVTASALTAELEAHHSRATPVLAPVLYTLALVPGVTRIYNGSHWTSDVVSGAFLGTFFGNRVVHYAHTHNRSRLDRALLGTALVPTERGGMMLVLTIDQ